MLTLDPVDCDKLNPQNSIRSHAGAGFFCNLLAQEGWHDQYSKKVLVAGCGAGHEATAIQAELDAEVDAVDIEDYVGDELKETSPVRFDVGSVCDLPFADESFDAIFYHHVIEHVDDPVASLDELSRVLKPEGWLFIGTPNRHRLLSSIGAHQQSEWDATVFNKVKDNLRDWKDRLTGKFRNELGAHAGFSRSELDGMLAKHFDSRHWVTQDYLRFKYRDGRVAPVLPLVTRPEICWFAAPAIYVMCRNS
ncbi:class I SAM-dependent methyltransferase [Neorhodopirellula pilleata]|uniref:Putative S-adenosylmethionine-dependent methyltransferase n=1 Tax=Neorhodopirellula pilleata TaxID=2714738 RepID=A0A5C6A388_9BACT|nr:class I SAM-dependent methyltransferase [Neorhodopirellula pilleata]TWT93718.1 putative S-adenosylmethionine-dependent methyltransferase [Neorhodopirellula pilleata]